MTLTREFVYGRNAARELYRGPRQVLETWVTERAAAQIPWLDSGPRPQVKPERVLSEAAGTRDHQGIVAWCEPFRYADAYELAAEEAPLLVCLDQVTDPHNLGAVVRGAEGAGATAVVVPAHGSARVTPAVCRASAGAVEHLAIARVRNLADFLAYTRDQGAWVYGAEAGAETAYTEPDYKGPVVLVLGSEGRGLRPRVRSACDQIVSLPTPGKLDSLNVSAAAAVLIYEALRQRGGTNSPSGLDKSP
jgi:23S rRNA (guanosine2251-2'-O)-methyltransferase